MAIVSTMIGENPLYAAFFTIIGLLSLFLYYRSTLPKYSAWAPKVTDKKPLSVEQADNKHRKFGHWHPETYKYPTPEAYPGWSLQSFKPLPYRAFRHKYNVTMGIRNMPKEDWIQLDNEWVKYHDLKKKRLSSDLKDQLFGSLPEGYPAAVELLYELREYLPKRYPSLFEMTKSGIKILETNEEFDFDNLKEDPMYYITQLIQDDIAIMIEGEDGEYYLKSGAILLAGFWRFKDKVNMSLNEIHFSGDVPKYKTHLQKGMEKFFQRITSDAPVVRNNYFLQTDDNLDWSISIGDEGSEKVGWYTAPPATDINQIFYRSERQSLRRLPLSGGVVFTIRTYFIPIVELCKEPFVPLRLLNGIESWDKDVKEYKGYDIFKDVTIPYLKKRAEEQEREGYTKEADKAQYPW